MSRRRPLSLMWALAALVSASLACATLNPKPNDFPPAPTDIGQIDVVEPTAAPESTEEPGDTATEPAEVPTEPQVGDTGTDLCKEGPADVPVMDVSTTFTYCDATTLSFQTGDASYDDVLKYYKDALESAGWSTDDSGIAVETTDAAVLYYSKDGRHIVVTVSYSSTDKMTSLQVIVSP